MIKNVFGYEVSWIGIKVTIKFKCEEDKSYARNEMDINERSV